MPTMFQPAFLTIFEKLVKSGLRMIAGQSESARTPCSRQQPQQIASVSALQHRRDQPFQLLGSIQPARKAISSGQATFSPWRFSTWR